MGIPAGTLPPGRDMWDMWDSPGANLEYPLKLHVPAYLATILFVSLRCVQPILYERPHRISNDKQHYTLKRTTETL